MSFSLTCPSCSAALAVEHQVGRTNVDCPECGVTIEVSDSPGEGYSETAIVPKALVAACVAGVAGAGAWALLAFVANYEVGYLAWAIGGAVGFATVKFGGRGKLMASLAAVVVLVAIFSGKIVAAQASIRVAINESTTQEMWSEYKDQMSVDAAAYKALGEDPTDEQVETLMREQNFVDPGTAVVSPLQIADFREYSVPELLEFDLVNSNYEDWSKRQEDWIHFQVEEQDGVVGLVADELGPLDLLFLFLGLSTAFGMVSRAD